MLKWSPRGDHFPRNNLFKVFKSSDLFWWRIWMLLGNFLIILIIYCKDESIKRKQKYKEVKKTNIILMMNWIELKIKKKCLLMRQCEKWYLSNIWERIHSVHLSDIIATCEAIWEVEIRMFNERIAIIVYNFYDQVNNRIMAPIWILSRN